MAKNGRPVPGSRAEVLLAELIDEVKGLRADLRRHVQPDVLDPHALGVDAAVSGRPFLAIGATRTGGADG